VRILHVVDRLRPEHGGTSGVVVRLAAAQKLFGLDVTVACHREGRLTQDIRSWKDEIRQFTDVEVVHCSLRPRQVSGLLRQFEIVHVHGVWMPFLAVVCWQAQRLGISTILAPHGMLATWSLAQKRFKKSLALSFVWRRLINDVSALHALNVAERNELRARFPRVNIQVIPNGIFPEEFTDSSTIGDLVGVVPSIRGRRYILSLARLHYVKGPDLLVEAFARIADRIPDLDLVVAGPDDGMAAPLKEAIAKAGLTGRVHLPGAVYGRAKLALLRDAVCMCQPSRHEGFSVSMLEALACGLPVVTTRTANFPEIESAGAGVIAEPNPPALAKALEGIASDLAMRERQSRAARTLALDRYTWAVVSRRAHEVYCESLASLGHRNRAGVDLRSPG
jgi:glycosyltransferase involved in cell wall biosynthesis